MNTDITNHFGLKYFITVCASILMAIWALPETIAMRHVLLILGFASSCIYLIRQKNLLLLRSSWPLWLFFSFFAWLLLHLLFFSNEFDLQLQELLSLWTRCFLASCIGLSLGLILMNSDQIEAHLNFDQSFCDRNSILVLTLFLGLSGTFFIFFGRYLYEVLITHQWYHFNFYNTPFKAKTPFVVAGAFFIPLCLIILIQALDFRIRKIWIYLALLGIGLSLFGNYFANTKNGMAVIVIALLVFFIRSIAQLFKVKNRFSFRLLLFIPLFLVCIYGAIQHVEKNPAWRNLFSDIKAGVDIDNQLYWQDHDRYSLPINQLGNEANVSTYERTAWFTAGIRLLIENPEGYGLAQHSFGSFGMTRWPNFYKPNGNTRGATHSGWLDFALGVGVPGLLLILIPLWVSWYRCLHRSGLWFFYARWTIPLMTFAFLIAEVTGWHFTEMLFYMTAFFSGLTLKQLNRKSAY